MYVSRWCWRSFWRCTCAFLVVLCIHLDVMASIAKGCHVEWPKLGAHGQGSNVDWRGACDYEPSSVLRQPRHSGCHDIRIYNNRFISTVATLPLTVVFSPNPPQHETYYADLPPTWGTSTATNSISQAGRCVWFRPFGQDRLCVYNFDELVN